MTAKSGSDHTALPAAGIGQPIPAANVVIDLLRTAENAGKIIGGPTVNDTCNARTVSMRIEVYVDALPAPNRRWRA